MFQLGKTIISEEILDKEFVCNLNACKGACCVEGEAGAPVSKEEGKILKTIYPKIKNFLRPEGIEAINKQGVYTINPIGDFETTLVDGHECAYAVFDENNMVKCAIEAAHKAGVVDFYKPISCHLYPIRVKEYSTLTAVNYHSWPICNDACTLGKELKVPTYQFVKQALIRMFGQDWYDELDTMAQEYYTNKANRKTKKS
jgi:hypothetical protein